MAPFEAITEVGLFGEPDAESPPGVPTYMQSKNAIGASTSFFAAEPKPGSDPYRASMSALRLWRRAVCYFLGTVRHARVSRFRLGHTTGRDNRATVRGAGRG